MKISLASLFLVVSMYFMGKAGENDTTLEPSFIAMVVGNIDSSVSWYERVLQVRLLSISQDSMKGFRQANLQGDGIHFELIELSQSLPQRKVLEDLPPETALRGVVKFGFTVNDFSQWQKHLQIEKVPIFGLPVPDAITGKTTLIVEDPDGNRIQFFES
jgi:catechol 2,3-dioxygenase-like lactoylglutathione lyase family enzyme